MHANGDAFMFYRLEEWRLLYKITVLSKAHRCLLPTFYDSRLSHDRYKDGRILERAEAYRLCFDLICEVYFSIRCLAIATVLNVVLEANDLVKSNITGVII